MSWNPFDDRNSSRLFAAAVVVLALLAGAEAWRLSRPTNAQDRDAEGTRVHEPSDAPAPPTPLPADAPAPPGPRARMPSASAPAPSSFPRVAPAIAPRASGGTPQKDAVAPVTMSRREAPRREAAPRPLLPKLRPPFEGAAPTSSASAPKRGASPSKGQDAFGAHGPPQGVSGPAAEPTPEDRTGPPAHPTLSAPSRTPGGDATSPAAPPAGSKIGGPAPGAPPSRSREGTASSGGAESSGRDSFPAPSRNGGGPSSGGSSPGAPGGSGPDPREPIKEDFSWLEPIGRARLARIEAESVRHGLWGACMKLGLYPDCRAACDTDSAGACTPKSAWNACLDWLGDERRCISACHFSAAYCVVPAELERAQCRSRTTCGADGRSACPAPPPYPHCTARWPADAPPPEELPLYNFVSDDKATCERDVQRRLGITASCTLGGGCCATGRPSARCPSLSPGAWGYCFDPAP